VSTFRVVYIHVAVSLEIKIFMRVSHFLRCHLHLLIMNSLIPDPPVIMRRFELEPFLANVQNFQINEMLMVPPIVIAIIMSGLGEKYSLKSVRSVTIGAAPLGKDAQDKLKSLLAPGTTVTQVWGMTEASCIVTTFYHPEDDSTGSVGRLMPNIEAKYGSPSVLIAA
jgi:acyl-CoA synthetase (AMP-forming)/AMP-acid ligase II